MFFGTLHRGSDWVDAGKIAEKFASILGFSTNADALRDLAANNQMLRVLREDFVRNLDRYPLHFTSFQETKGCIGINGLDALVRRSKKVPGAQ